MMEMVKRTNIYICVCVCGKDTVLLRKAVAYKTSLALVGLVVSPLSVSLFPTQRPFAFQRERGKGKEMLPLRDI